MFCHETHRLKLVLFVKLEEEVGVGIRCLFVLFFLLRPKLSGMGMEMAVGDGCSCNYVHVGVSVVLVVGV